jgi:hypothetical protein
MSWLSDASPVQLARDGKLSAGAIAASVVPPVFRAPFEAITGEILYTGRQAVPRRLQDVEPEEQYTKRTPGMFKAAGKAFGVSPIKLQVLSRGLLGGVGYDPSPAGMLDAVAFRVVGTTGGAKLDKAYKVQDEAKQGYATARLKIKELLESGKRSDAMKIKEDWNRKILDHILPKMKRITGQSYQILMSSGFYNAYTFQARDWKALEEGDSEGWVTGLEDQLGHKFFK